MSTKYILIVHGEPFSIFSEVLGKYFIKKRKFKKKIIIIGNKQLLKKQLKKLKYNFPLNEIKNYLDADINSINIIDINFSYKEIFSNISRKSNKYIEDCFKKSLDIIKSNNDFILINGPISKKTFLNKKYSGITEYLSQKTNSRDEVMLIYNNKLSVTPLSTHIPIKNVTRQLKKDRIVKNVINIDNFYKNILKKESKVAVLGLNPHCETTDKFSEEDKIIKPSINYLKKRGLNISGPFSADTFFIKKI